MNIENLTDQRLKRDVYEVDAALRRAVKIILSRPECGLFFHVGVPGLGDKFSRGHETMRFAMGLPSAEEIADAIVPWKDLLQTMVRTLAGYTGKNPKVVAAPVGGEAAATALRPAIRFGFFSGD